MAWTWKDDWPSGKISCDHLTKWGILGNWQTSWHKEENFLWILDQFLLCWKKHHERWKNRNVTMWDYRGSIFVPLFLWFLWSKLPQKDDWPPIIKHFKFQICPGHGKRTDSPGKISCDHVTKWGILGNWQTSWHKEANFFCGYLINLLLCWKKVGGLQHHEGERTEMWPWGIIEGVSSPVVVISLG